MTTPDYAALASDYINRPKDGLLDHLRAYHEADKREETFEIFENLEDIGPINYSQEYSYWFDVDEGLLLINELIDEAVRELGVTGHWMCDDPGTLYLSEMRRNYDADSPAEHARIESEAHAIQEAAVGIYNAFREQLTPEILAKMVDEAEAEQQQAEAERLARNAAKASVPQIDRQALEFLLGVTHTDFRRAKFIILKETNDPRDVLHVRPGPIVGTTVEELAEAMRTLLRAGDYAVGPYQDNNSSGEELVVQYVPGKPPRTEAELPTVEAIVAVIQRRMSGREWAEYIASLVGR